MTARATRLASVPELTTLVVVFPDLAMLPCGMGNCVAGFHGDRVIIVSNTTREFLGSPLELQEGLAQLGRRAEVQTLRSEMFGNRRGFILPVELAVRIVAAGGLAADRDRILLTGCYRGWLPGSIDVLAEALGVLRFHVEIDADIPRR